MAYLSYILCIWSNVLLQYKELVPYPSPLWSVVDFCLPIFCMVVTVSQVVIPGDQPDLSVITCPIASLQEAETEKHRAQTGSWTHLHDGEYVQCFQYSNITIFFPKYHNIPNDRDIPEASIFLWIWPIICLMSFFFICPNSQFCNPCSCSPPLVLF